MSQTAEYRQADLTHWRLAGRTDAEILHWLDDCSRYALSVTAHRRVTSTIVHAASRKTVERQRIPYSTLIDNGVPYHVEAIVRQSLAP